jgi:hypothetical protein
MYPGDIWQFPTREETFASGPGSRDR